MQVTLFLKAMSFILGIASAQFIRTARLQQLVSKEDLFIL